MDQRRDASPALDDVLKNVLVIEDDGQTSEMVSRALERAGFTARVVSSDEAARDWIQRCWADLVVLDMRFCARDGGPLFDFIRASSNAPVVLVSPGGDANERARALELGADDFVPAPLSPAELVARVRSVLRRAPSTRSTAADRTPRGSPLVLDTQTRRVRVLGRWVVLTALEFALLEFLMGRPNQTFSKDALLEHVWGYTVGDASTVTVHVRRLREKIEPLPAAPVFIVTVWGVGYRFDPSAGQSESP